MDSRQQPHRFRTLVDALREGRINRRQFLERSTALGVGFGVATFMANTVVAGSGINPTGKTEAWVADLSSTAPIPEPLTMLTLTLGIGRLGTYVRRRLKRR